MSRHTKVPIHVLYNTCFYGPKPPLLFTISEKCYEAVHVKRRVNDEDKQGMHPSLKRRGWHLSTRNELLSLPVWWERRQLHGIVAYIPQPTSLQTTLSFRLCISTNMYILKKHCYFAFCFLISCQQHPYILSCNLYPCI